MEKHVLRKALWEILRPLMQLISNLLNPEKGEEWEREFKRFLRKEECWKTPKWTEENGIIRFTITSDGTSGPEWISRLEAKGFRISDYAKSILLSPDFKPTNCVTTQITVLNGKLFGDSHRTTSNIRTLAIKRGLSTPNPEIACLIRETFSDKEIEAMGLWRIVTMHEPIKGSGGDPNLLGTNRGDDAQWLRSYWGSPDRRWNADDGFAFVASQIEN